MAKNTVTTDLTTPTGDGALAVDQLQVPAGGIVRSDTGAGYSGITTTTAATTAELDALHSQGCVAADFAKLHAGPAVIQQTKTAGAALRTDTVAHLQADVITLLTAAGIISAT